MSIQYPVEEMDLALRKLEENGLLVEFARNYEIIEWVKNGKNSDKAPVWSFVNDDGVECVVTKGQILKDMEKRYPKSTPEQRKDFYYKLLAYHKIDVDKESLDEKMSAAVNCMLSQYQLMGVELDSEDVKALKGLVGEYRKLVDIDIKTGNGPVGIKEVLANNYNKYNEKAREVTEEGEKYSKNQRREKAETAGRMAVFNEIRDMLTDILLKREGR